MRFGPAGYPSEGKTPKGALEYTRSLGLDALEVEFVRGARISPERAAEVGAKAKELDIRLSCHAPYFISFNSDSEETRAKSVDWVTSTARAAHHLGAYLIVIHAASYGKHPEAALQSVVDGLIKSKDVLDDEGIKDVKGDSLPSEPPGKSKNTGVDGLSLLQGIFPTQELNWGLLHCRQILYQLSYQGIPGSEH